MDGINYEVPHCKVFSWSLLDSPFSSILGPNIRLKILFSNTLSLLCIYVYMYIYKDTGININNFLASVVDRIDSVWNRGPQVYSIF